MIADVANWVLINVLINPRVFMSLLALIVLIVAGFLMSEKPTKKISSKRKRILGAVLFVFAIFVFLHANIADLADVFTVWATLILAGVALFSFEESRRLREDNRQREERDRKERWLNEIIEWATDVLEASYEISSKYPGLLTEALSEKENSAENDVKDMEEKQKKYETFRDFSSLLLIKLKTISGRKGYIKQLSSSSTFEQEKDLQLEVDKSIDNLTRGIEHLELISKNMLTEEEYRKFEEYKKANGTIYGRMIKLLEEAGKVRIR